MIIGNSGVGNFGSNGNFGGAGAAEGTTSPQGSGFVQGNAAGAFLKQLLYSNSIVIFLLII